MGLFLDNNGSNQEEEDVICVICQDLISPDEKMAKNSSCLHILHHDCCRDYLS